MVEASERATVSGSDCDARRLGRTRLSVSKTRADPLKAVA
jgi:hypothetical protein